MPEMPYQVYLYVGGNVPPAPQGVTVVDLTPSAATAEAVLEALERTGLTAADLRTRVLFIADPAFRDEAVMAYAALCGFAGRRVDFTDLTSVYEVRALHERAGEAPDAGKPETLPDLVQAGATHPDTGVASFVDVLELTPEDVSTIRYARQARLALADRTVGQALTLLVAFTGLRVRGGSDRFPLLVAGTEPADVPEGDTVGVDLDALRRTAAEARRSRRVDDRNTLVDPVELTVRQQALCAAAAVPVEDTLGRLGSYMDDETGFWRCPRPERHKNGDANPSTRVSEGLVRCFRCDTEPVDSLRLVIDCQRVSPDEAAAWLLDPAVPAV